MADGIAALGDHHHVPAAVSASGVLVYQSAPGGWDLYLYALDVADAPWKLWLKSPGGPEVRRTQISSNGGSDPRFSPDGRLIFFRTPAPLGGSDKNSFAIAVDGKSLIVARPESAAAYVVHVKTGWGR